MRLLIRACPHTGTRYTAQFLQTIGVDIGHEVKHSAGIITWYIDGYFNEDNYIYLHQVREPLEHISSFMNMDNVQWSYISENSHNYGCYIPRKSDILLRSMQLFYFWNSFLQRNSIFSFPVEEPEAIVAILDLFNISYNKDKLKEAELLPKIGKSLGEKQKLTFDILYDKDKNLAKRIQRQTKKYGY